MPGKPLKAFWVASLHQSLQMHPCQSADAGRTARSPVAREPRFLWCTSKNSRRIGRPDPHIVSLCNEGSLLNIAHGWMG